MSTARVLRLRVQARTVIAAIVLVCLNALGVYSQAELKKKRKPESRYLYQVTAREKQSGRKQFGFIDKTGKQVIEFDRLPETTIAVGDFHEGRARIYVNHKEHGEYRQRQNDRVGFIDETGKVIIDAHFATARDFSEGLAYVEAKDFKGFIDRFGKLVIKTDYRLTKDFHEGLAAVGMNDTGPHNNWGYIDRSGKLVINQEYSFADDFSEGLAGVEVDRKYGFINQRGEMVIPPRFGLLREPYYTNRTLSSGRFVEGLACVREVNLYGYINRKGAFVISPQFTHAQEFSEGLAWVRKRQSNGVQVGWIDRSGRWLVTRIKGYSLSSYTKSANYANASMDWRYSEGLVPVDISFGDRSLVGYLNRKGEVVIEPRDFEQAGPFIGGIAWVIFHGNSSYNEEYGYLNRKGQLIWRSE